MDFKDKFMYSIVYVNHGHLPPNTVSINGCGKNERDESQAKIKTPAKRFEDDEIDRVQHLEGLSLLFASKK